MRARVVIRCTPAVGTGRASRSGMSARLFRDGDTLIGHFETGVRFARVSFLDRHSDALCFVDADGRDLGPLVGGFVSLTPAEAEAHDCRS